MNSGDIPNDWKKANVTVVFSKRTRHCTLNYGPISLTSIVCKILESIIKDHVMEHLLVNKPICPDQQGFVPQYSKCMTQEEVLDLWTKAYDHGKCIDVAFVIHERHRTRVHDN